jgi:hypothetical protein
MPADAKAKVLADLAAAHIDFKETARAIPAEKLTEVMHGEWSAKDLVAHVASWDEVASLDLRRIGRGHVPTLAAFREADVDEWNAFLMRGRRLFPPPQVFHELEECYDMLVEALETVPEAMFQEGGIVTNLLAITIHHYGDHGGHIREWREREGI